MNKEIERKEDIVNQLHTIQEEIENDFGTAFSGNLRNGGGPEVNSRPTGDQQRNVGECGDGRGWVINIEDIDWVVGGGTS